MQIEIEATWLDGDAILRRTNSAHEVRSDDVSPDLETAQIIKLLDRTWMETRAALLVTMSERSRKNVGVWVVLTREQAERFEQ